MDPIAVNLREVSKYYKLYASNKDRLKESLHPLGKQYHRKFYALKDINLDIAKGEIIGVVGRNGSGKSTLLKLISHVLVPNSGHIKVNGNVSALLELGAGFNPEFTGIQNIHFYATILGLSKTDIAGKLDQIIEFADIGSFIQQPLKTYSSGMKSRLGFAVAVHIDPEILILDEVLAVGDIVFKRKCYAKMEELFRSGRTIIYVSHDTNSVNQLCTRAILLEGGEIIMDGEPKIITAFYQKLMFASDDGVAGVQEEIRGHSEGVNPGGIETPQKPDPPPRFLEEFKSKNRMEYRNQSVDIVGECILDPQGNKVNVLEYGKDYTFCVDVRFGVSSTDVAFGLEIKDIKGVLITSVESAQLYRMGKSFHSVNEKDLYRIRYRFTCRFSVGTYLINFGVCSYTGEQDVLNRIIDLYMFKVENEGAVSAGYVQILNKMEVSQGGKSEFNSLIDFR